MHPDIGYENFLRLYKEYSDKEEFFNEADTRAKIIDLLLKDCLGWKENFITRENPNDSGYTDYELSINKIPVLVIEAKKSGEYFEIAKTLHGRTYKIAGSISTSKNLYKAFNQVRTYCNDIGCKYAAVSNGHQLASFSAITIGKSWKEGVCVVYKSFDDIKDNFTQFWNTFSFDAIRTGLLRNVLEGKRRELNFKKIISEIHNPDQSWARNELYIYIRPICDFVFSELLDETRTEVLKECYVYDESSIPLSDEIENYFVDKLPHFAEKYKIAQIYQTEVKAGAFQKQFMTKSYETYDKTKGSLIVLLGGVGVGKSTFLHRFFRIILANHENLLWFYIDFRGAPLREIEIEEFIFNKIEEYWHTKYEPKLREILDNIGFSVDKTNLKEFYKKLFNLLRNLKFSVAIIIDNVDQHDINLQEKIFLCGHHLTDTLRTVTIVALREETFMASTRAGVFDAFHIHKFHISSPNFLGMIFKRIDFSIKLLRRKEISKIFTSISKEAKQELIKYFSIIKTSLYMKNEQSKKIVKFIDSVSVGNMRDALRMFNNFIVSGNTNIKEIFSKYEKSGGYQLAYHQFIKSIILGEYRYYIQERSQLMNVFDFDPSLTDSHFHILRILKCLLERSNKKSPIGRGYVLIDDLLREGEMVSISQDVIKDSLLRASTYNLVEYDNQSRVDIENAAYVKITPAGSYYLQNLVHEFTYLDCVLIDTPISNESLLTTLRNVIHSTDLIQRLDRTQSFLEYLVNMEQEEFKSYPEYLHNEFTNQYFSEKMLDLFKELKNEILKGYKLNLSFDFD